MRVSIKRHRKKCCLTANVSIFIDDRYAVSMEQQLERTVIFHQPIRLYVKSGMFKSPTVEVTRTGSLEIGFNYKCLWLLLTLLVLLKVLFPIGFLRVLVILAVVFFAYYVKNYALQLKSSE